MIYMCYQIIILLIQMTIINKQHLIICLIFITVIQSPTEKLSIKDESGNEIEMDYLAPELLEAQIKGKDIKIGDIGPFDIEEVQIFLSDKATDTSIAQSLYDIRNANLTYQAQYYYYNQKFNLDQMRKETPFCIVSPYYNFFSGASWHMYLDTLENQNYTNFEVIMTDDVSTDNSVEKLLEMIEEKYPRLSNRLKIVKNREYIQMMGNHDIEIRNYCKKGTIIAEVDGDDTLLGRQVLNVLNAVYQEKPDTWVVYTNFLMKMRSGKYRKLYNSRIPDSTYITNSYRTGKQWITSHLKTYRREVYMKIPPSYFQRSQGKYYLFGADIFIMIAIIQLSGQDHTRYLDQLMYYYRLNINSCSTRLNSIGQYLARMKTPFLPLQNLNDSAQLMSNYTLPPLLIQQYNEKININYQCVVDLRKKISDQTYMMRING